MSGRTLSVELLPALRGAAHTRHRRSLSPEGAYDAAYSAHLAAAARPPARAGPPRDVVAGAQAGRRGATAARSLKDAAPFIVAFVAASFTLVVVGAPFVAGGASQLLTVLITGLTTGGLSCMALQGGLLATSLSPRAGGPAPGPPARVISSFLLAKLVAYTLLGALLGLFGSVAQLSIGARGAMQVAIGVFMLATAVRMLRPTPWLNFLALEPPAAVRRMIRKRARGGDESAIMLGALTVLIPCGVTQAMMAVAISTGNPIAGALTMALFTAGTSPVFFGLSYAATSLGKHAEQTFNRVVGIVILILGYVAIQTGANLLGHPLPLRPVFVGISPMSSAAATHAGSDGIPTITVRVLDNRYEPAQVTTVADKPARLRFVTKGVTGCTRTLNIPKLGLQKALPTTGSASVTIPGRKDGTTIRWVCGMGMYSGTVTFTKYPR